MMLLGANTDDKMRDEVQFSSYKVVELRGSIKIPSSIAAFEICAHELLHFVGWGGFRYPDGCRFRDLP